MPFPDGTGAAGGLSPFDGTYTAGAAPGVGPSATPGAPGLDGTWPEGLAPPTVDGGLPAWVTDPNSFVPAPDARDESGEGLAPILLGRGAPGTTFDVEAALRAQLAAQAAASGPQLVQLAAGDPATRLCPGCGKQVPFKAKKCPDCGYDFSVTPTPSKPDGKQHLAILYGTGVPLSLSAKSDDAGFTWKVACKTGTLALSPGPGQVDLDVPLTLTSEDFADIKTAFDEKAFPYVTVPETHANGSLENTGYVKALESLSKEQLMADARITQEGKDHVADDPDETEYLLAGIHWTKATAKQAADEGSIADTSIGIKMDYRNKRTGTTYRRALEHLALTPVPWVDGLIPFNPAMALSGPSWDQGGPPATPVVLDGVWTERPREALDLAMRIEQTGDGYDAVATRAALMALQPGDELSWNYDVRVERLAADGEGVYFLVRAPQNVDPTDYGWDRKPTLYADAESAMSAITTGVATCLQRRANERARVAAQIAANGADAPAVSSYAADGDTEGMNLSVIQFDPQKHPRDLKGHFRGVVGKLKDGETARLPDGQQVTRRDVTLNEAGAAKRGKPTRVMYEQRHKNSSRGSAFYDEAGAHQAADAALKDSTSFGKKGEMPTDAPQEQATKPVPAAALPADNGQALEQAFGDVRLQVETADADSVSFNLPGGDDEYNDYHLAKGGPEDAVVTQAGPDDWVLTEYPLDAYDEDTDGYDPELLTHEVLGPDRDAAFKKVAEILGGRVAKGKPQASPAPVAVDAFDPKALGLPSGWEYNGDDGAGHHEILDADGYAYALFQEDGAWHLMQQDMDGEEEASWSAATPAEAVKKMKADPHHQDSVDLFGQDFGQDPTGTDEDTLSLSGSPGSLDGVTRHGAPGMTIEEILAQQQAAIEALQTQLADATSQNTHLSTQVGDQGAVIHAGNVGAAIRKLNGKYPPSALLAAQTVMLADKPWEREEGGLNLSVVVPSEADPSKLEAKQLTTPTEIVEFMLSAMPTVDGSGAAAVQLAVINEGLDQLHLAAHRAENAADPVVQARANVDEWERHHKPHLYNPDGTRKAA